MFDIWYRNTSDIVPTAITGDMHSVNKANFAILHWFGLRFEPRFTNLDEQLKELYCADDPALYEKCLIRPVGQIDRQAHRRRESQHRPDRRHAGPQGDDPGHPDPQAVHLHRAEPDAAGDLRVRQADPQHLHACATCAIRNWSATSTARRTASSPTTSCARPSPRSAARRS